MKKYLLFSVVSLILVACGGGGGDDPDIPVISKDYIDVTPNVQLLGDGQETELKVSANCAWTISFSASWLTVTPTSGRNNENLTISASKNSSGEERITTLTIKGGNAPTKTVVVTQPKGSEAPTLSVDHNTLDFDWKSETKKFEISTNVAWIISKPEWCTISKSSGKGNEEIVVTASDNAGKYIRTGEIVINGDGVSPVTISVTQKCKDVENSEEPEIDDNTPPE